jgi:hypothetical protein
MRDSSLAGSIQQTPACQASLVPTKSISYGRMSER